MRLVVVVRYIKCECEMEGKKFQGCNNYEILWINYFIKMILEFNESELNCGVVFFICCLV